MPEPIIKVDNISKRYRIGLKEDTSDSIGGAVLAAIKSPLRNFRNLRNLTSFKKEDGKDVFWALRDVSFELQQGEVLGIIGKNGAGKSTLLKILSRITPPTEGKISINGRVASLLEVGTGFHTDLTGRENVYLNGTILGMQRKEIDRKFDEIVAFSGVEKFIDTPVKRYSSGMTVRLAFAVAAHLDPEILIIDEVLAVGDAEFQKKCMGKMKDVAGLGKTVLFVSHNMTAVKGLCSTAILLRGGKIVSRGRTEDVLDNYLNYELSNIVKRSWSNGEAPGNEWVKILKASVSPVGDSPDFKITLATPLKVEFEFTMLKGGFELHLSLLLFRADGEVIFNTFTPIINGEQKTYKAECFIPGNLLNDGNYSFELCVVKDHSELLYKHSELLVFEVLDHDREVLYFRKVVGSVRPKLDWKFPA